MLDIHPDIQHFRPFYIPCRPWRDVFKSFPIIGFKLKHSSHHFSTTRVDLVHDIIHDMNRETAMLHISRICQRLQSLSLYEKSKFLQRSIFIQKDLQLNWECPAPHSPWAVLQDRPAWGGGTRCTSPRWSQRTQAGWKIKFSEWVQTIDRGGTELKLTLFIFSHLWVNQSPPYYRCWYKTLTAGSWGVKMIWTDCFSDLKILSGL